MKKSNTKTLPWVKNLGSQAGEMYVSAELSKRGIPNALLRKNFPSDDIIIFKRDGTKFGYIQVKSCHPDRNKTFLLKEQNEKWVDASDKEFVVFVWLGSPQQNEPPMYWIARKKDAGAFCIEHRPPENSKNWERRFSPDQESMLVPKAPHPRIPKEWRINCWDMFREYMPESDSTKSDKGKKLMA
jgi:hypothetical protein